MHPTGNPASMKHTAQHIFSLVAAVFLAHATGASAQQQWTNQEGETITAHFARIEGANVVIKLADGRQVPFLLAKLDKASQEQARELANAKPAATPPPAKDTPPAAIPARSPRDPALPLIGAIRWDAWTGGWVTETMQKTLGPAKYHDRLPWFAEVKGDGAVKLDAGKQQIMDAEIAMATSAGLDYWAFLLYPESDVMSVSLKQYLKSRQRKDIGFCMVLHNALKVPDNEWPQEENPKTCQANAIIMYAWNEHDEGGWLVPTWTPEGKPNTSRLDAIRRVLRPDAAAAK